VTCTLFAESQVSDTIDGRIAALHYRVLDQDPGCVPILVQLELSYTDVHGNSQHTSSESTEGPDELRLTAHNAADDADAVGRVLLGYDGCDLPGDCLTSRELRPK
jgi:hypothetical protein